MKAAGYSGTPLYKKLGIKPGHRVWFAGSPSGYEGELRNIGEFERVDRLIKGLDFLHFFTASRKTLTSEIIKLRDAMNPNGMLWISWPKKTAGVPTDLDENVVREIGLKVGLVDVKVCAVDETWSALKFVFRLKDR